MQSRLFLVRVVRRASRAAAAAFALVAFAAPLALADSAPLKAGIATSPQIEALKVAAKEAQGLDVKIIEFTDWSAPLANQEIDVNHFHHIPFLENAKKQGGYDFVAIAPRTIMKIGLYSRKIKRFDQPKDGAPVVIANDPRIRRFIAIHQHSPAVRKSLDNAFGSLYVVG
ncbi:MetQ/NlpA family ABC transporter substrate-binding protein [Burkholderia thailandensis]|uniref:MetQ/NlpA family ABC transporter substrate-binding protein n=1 Tax=Burkholderia thailandensis TaxID=57975 RepID=UPI0013770B12|nr:MetQ/NlpA family ABC transporter substrate-binding protein [Burkholderia thailandensis]MCS6512952.1 MetQ/NlpA family ABC transporter substrate-binding protein [Burkholderia thailandensis]NBD05520.1 hypothetical protein [Burkholderia thailandensis]NOK56435.1 hypothetical protein [Burkholderia thailandensis]